VSSENCQFLAHSLSRRVQFEFLIQESDRWRHRLAPSVSKPELLLKAFVVYAPDSTADYKSRPAFVQHSHGFFNVCILGILFPSGQQSRIAYGRSRLRSISPLPGS